MVNEQQVAGIMRDALFTASKSNKIELENVRVKLFLGSDLDSTVCEVLDKTNTVGVLSWQQILGLKAMFKSVIVKNITKKFKDIADKNKIAYDQINVRVYTKTTEGTPLLFLYNGGKAIKNVELKELI